ncbi:uncharacterized protein [Mytilus edulis]|uniref:uncharacterized protein n=1 Tax=Mytilus edulis TaxID=6550 RepID=UPI0039F07B25
MEETNHIMTIFIPRMYGICYVFYGIIFEDEFFHQCERMVRKMEKKIKLHRQIYKQLQKQQKVCWLANSKVTTYQHCLDTSKKIYDHVAETLNKREMRSKQTAISKVQNHLQAKLKLAKRAEEKYQTILANESKTRSSIKEIEQDIFRVIELQTNDRKLTSASDNKKIHTTISVETLVEKMSSRYLVTLPQVFNEKKGFHAKLPDVLLVKREFHSEKL